jgi:hypothetical protein
MLMGAALVGARLRGGTKSALFCLLGPFHRTVCRHPPCSRSSRSWCALYAPGRGAVHLHTLLKHYRGIVQCDGYAPYKKLPDDAITLAFCWAHVRRGFFEIARKGNAPIATQALMRIAALYRIEQTIRGKNAEQRVAVRREQSAPHCEALKRFLERQLGRVSAKAPIAQAIRYTLKHWQGLTRFLDDGRIDLDSNIVERSMRPQVLTRKNALFAGHDDGAQNWAIAASLIELQTRRHRSVQLPCRRSLPSRQSLAEQPSRRAPPLELGCRKGSPATRRLTSPQMSSHRPKGAEPPLTYY